MGRLQGLKKGVPLNARFIVAVGALALAAGSAAAATTPTQYRAQAGAICTSTSARLHRITPPTSKREVNPYLKQSLPIFRAQWQALKKLDPPRVYRFLHLKVLSLEKIQINGIQLLIYEIDQGADPEKAFRAIDIKLEPVSNAETVAWKKLHVTACEDL